MKKMFSLLGLIAALILMTNLELEAVGGRGGGGGGRGGGGGSRGGGSPRGGAGNINRSPSMSRAAVSRPQNVAARPNVERPNINPSNRPNIQQTPRPNIQQVSRPKLPVDNRPAIANRPIANTNTKNQVQQFIKNRPITLPGQQTVNRPNVNPGNWSNIGQNIRNQNLPNQNNVFNRNFWVQHNAQPAYWNQNGNFWRGATAVGVASWLRWNNNAYPYGYYYGDGYYGDSSLYASTIPQQGTYNPPAETTNGDWMALGVFAVTKNGASNANPNLYQQLALNKDGSIAGTLYNSITDKTYDIVGWVDPDSQRAAWKIDGNDNSPIMETGIYNLAQSESPVKVNFANGTSQDMLLIRLQ